jgi:hypothetical protein
MACCIARVSAADPVGARRRLTFGLANRRETCWVVEGEVLVSSTRAPPSTLGIDVRWVS